MHHATDSANRIGSLVVDVGEESESSRPFVYDAAGNLVCDGTWFYQYDAFNRLMQVNEMGTLTFDAAGRVASGAPGALSAAYTYDGLGAPGFTSPRGRPRVFGLFHKFGVTGTLFRACSDSRIADRAPAFLEKTKGAPNGTPVVDCVIVRSPRPADLARGL